MKWCEKELTDYAFKMFLNPIKIAAINQTRSCWRVDCLSTWHLLHSWEDWCGQCGTENSLQAFWLSSGWFWWLQRVRQNNLATDFWSVVASTAWRGQLHAFTSLLLRWLWVTDQLTSQRDQEGQKAANQPRYILLFNDFEIVNFERD